MTTWGQPRSNKFYKGSSHQSTWTNDLLWQKFVSREEQQLQNSAKEAAKGRLGYSGHQVVMNSGPLTKPYFYGHLVIPPDGVPMDAQYQEGRGRRASRGSSRGSSRSRPATALSGNLSSRSFRASATLSQSTPLLISSPIQTRTSSISSKRPITALSIPKNSTRIGGEAIIRNSTRSRGSRSGMASDRSGLSVRQMDELKVLIRDQVREFANLTSNTIGDLRKDLAKETEHTQEVQAKLQQLLDQRRTIE